jgi:hypothetical protein
VGLLRQKQTKKTHSTHIAVVSYVLCEYIGTWTVANDGPSDSSEHRPERSESQQQNSVLLTSFAMYLMYKHTTIGEHSSQIWP